MCRPRETLYTKAQLAYLFNVWECEEPIPPKGKAVCVCWPNQDWEVDLAVCEFTDLKSDTGERLYRVTLTSKNGRAIEERIQEAHVLAYREYLLGVRRASNVNRAAMTLEAMA